MAFTRVYQGLQGPNTSCFVCVYFHPHSHLHTLKIAHPLVNNLRGLWYGFDFPRFKYRWTFYIKALFQYKWTHTWCKKTQFYWQYIIEVQMISFRKCWNSYPVSIFTSYFFLYERTSLSTVTEIYVLHTERCKTSIFDVDNWIHILRSGEQYLIISPSFICYRNDCNHINLLKDDDQCYSHFD